MNLLFQLSRYCKIGALVSLVHLTLSTILISLGSNSLFANAIVFSILFPLSLVLNKIFVFNSSARILTLKAFIIYILTLLLATFLSLQFGLQSHISDGIDVYFHGLLIQSLFSLIIFTLYKAVIFR